MKQIKSYLLGARKRTHRIHPKVWDKYMQTHVTNYQIPHFRALRIFLRIKHKVKLASLMLHQIQNYKKRQKPKGEKTTKQTALSKLQKLEKTTKRGSG